MLDVSLTISIYFSGHSEGLKYFSVCILLDFVTEPQINKGAIGKVFKKDAKAILDHVAQLDEIGLAEMEKSLADTG